MLKATLRMWGSDNVEEYQDVLGPPLPNFSVPGSLVEVVTRTTQVEAGGQTNLTNVHPHTFDGLAYGQTVSSRGSP